MSGIRVSAIAGSIPPTENEANGIRDRGRACQRGSDLVFPVAGSSGTPLEV